jgi:hypothetical protein
MRLSEDPKSPEAERGDESKSSPDPKANAEKFENAPETAKSEPGIP